MADQNTRDTIEEFLREGPWAVVGASEDRSKYGNKVLRAYFQSGREAWPVNPRAEQIEGREVYATLADLPSVPRAISIITPPKITEKVVAEAAELGVEHVWMQPGAQSDAAVAAAEEAGLGVIADGSCLLVVTGYREGEGEA